MHLLRIFRQIEKPPTADQGFSLVDAMVGMAVFAIVALALASQASRTILANHSAKRTTTSAVRASQEVDQMISLRYHDTRIDDGTFTIPADEGYAISYEVREDDALPNTKSVKMTVTFTEKGGSQRTVSYNYLLPEII